MAKSRAVILAAGRGVRMGGEHPKTLLPVADHEPLLHYILRGLRRAGVSKLSVVTGFGARSVQDYVTEQWDAEPPSFVFNARYASWGNFHSLRVALDASPGAELLVVNSDVVVHPDVYARVLEAAGDLVLAVQRKRRLDAEDMRVELTGDQVRSIGKHLELARSQGEFCGVSLIRPEAARRYIDVASANEWRGATAGYYEDVYAEVLSHVDARAAAVGEEEYAEVDEPGDVAAAAAVIARHSDAWRSEGVGA